jgi:hypothetical protein
MSMKWTITLLVFFVTFCAVKAQKKETIQNNFIYVGAIETKLPSWFLFEPKFNGDTTPIKIIRPLFYKNEKGWFSLETKIEDRTIYPKSRKWHIAFDGKNLGSFNSKSVPIEFAGYNWTYARDSYHLISDSTVPTIGKKSIEFSGFEYEEQFRPLVGVSLPYYKDPENWKPFNPDSNNLKILVEIYKSYFNIRDFDKDYFENGRFIFLKSYQSNKKHQLIQMAFKSNDNIKYPLWIYKSNTGKLINISKIIDLKFSQDEFTDDDISTNTLIESGDFDNNGKSEIIFWSSRYNGDGYVMFYENFSRMVDFTWGYH